MHTPSTKGGSAKVLSGHGSHLKSLLGINVIVRDSKSSGPNQYNKNGM